MRHLPLTLILLLALASCKEQPGYIVKNENGGDPVYSLGDEDKAMNVAKTKAIQTYPDFLTTFASQDSSNSDFSVKCGFHYGPGGDGTEHMWLTELHYKGDKLFGLLGNTPANVVAYQIGDTIEVDKRIVSDWMYARNGKLVGGYTIRVLYDKMTAVEKQEFAKEFLYKIE
jgi:uncharacterized protein YegJ (DUF2314 family)